MKEEFNSKIHSERFRSFVHELDSLSLEKPKVNPEKNYVFYFNAEKGTMPYDSYFSISIEKRCILITEKSFDSFIWNLEHEDRWNFNSSKKLAKAKFGEKGDSELLSKKPADTSSF